MKYILSQDKAEAIEQCEALGAKLTGKHWGTSKALVAAAQRAETLSDVRNLFERLQALGEEDRKELNLNRMADEPPMPAELRRAAAGEIPRTLVPDIFAELDQQ